MQKLFSISHLNPPLKVEDQWTTARTSCLGQAMSWSAFAMHMYTYSQFVLFFVIIDKHISAKHNNEETNEN